MLCHAVFYDMSKILGEKLDNFTLEYEYICSRYDFFCIDRLYLYRRHFGEWHGLCSYETLYKEGKMGVRKTGSILVKGAVGNMGKIVIPGLTGLEAAKVFLQAIGSAYMEGTAISASYSETESLPAEVTGGNTDRKAIIFYMDNVSSQRKRISIPSWGNDAGDKLNTPDGERVPLVACQSVVEALEVATGRSLTALEGYIIQKR